MKGRPRKVFGKRKHEMLNEYRAWKYYTPCNIAKRFGISYCTFRKVVKQEKLAGRLI